MGNVTRRKTTPDSTSGSFAPGSAGTDRRADVAGRHTPGPTGQYITDGLTSDPGNWDGLAVASLNDMTVRTTEALGTYERQAYWELVAHNENGPSHAEFQREMDAQLEDLRLPPYAEDLAVALDTYDLNKLMTDTSTRMEPRDAAQYTEGLVNGTLATPDRARWQGPAVAAGGVSEQEMDAFYAGQAHQQQEMLLGQRPWAHADHWKGLSSWERVAYDAGEQAAAAQQRVRMGDPLTPSETVLVSTGPNRPAMRVNGISKIAPGFDAQREEDKADDVRHGYTVNPDGSPGQPVKFPAGQVFAIDDGHPRYGN